MTGQGGKKIHIYVCIQNYYLLTLNILITGNLWSLLLFECGNVYVVYCRKKIIFLIFLQKIIWKSVVAIQGGLKSIAQPIISAKSMGIRLCGNVGNIMRYNVRGQSKNSTVISFEETARCCCFVFSLVSVRLGYFPLCLTHFLQAHRMKNRCSLPASGYPRWQGEEERYRA